jgi:hypothetical protein
MFLAIYSVSIIGKSGGLLMAFTFRLVDVGGIILAPLAEELALVKRPQQLTP